MKNKEKYMKEIYKIIPSEILASYIGVDKQTNKPFACRNSENKFSDCERCKFMDKVDGYCHYEKIKLWLEKEED